MPGQPQVGKPGGWFSPRPGSVGLLAFILHRLSGLGLVFYLYLHLVILNQLRQGPAAWDALLRTLRSPLVLALDGLLLFGLILHALNGLRLSLLGLGLAVRWQRSLFWACLAISILLTALGMWALAGRG